MRKIKLDVGSLSVESFTLGGAFGAGTVRGRESQDVAYETIQATCGQNETCKQFATCDDTCKPYTQQLGCGGAGGTESGPYPTCGCPEQPWSADFNSCDQRCCGSADC